MSTSIIAKDTEPNVNFACPTILVENIKLTPNGSNYDATFTLTGAPPTYNGYAFAGYFFSVPLIIVPGNPPYVVDNCFTQAVFDPTVKYCTLEYNPVCACNGVTFSNSCFKAKYIGTTSLHDGECTGNEKVEFTIKSIPPGTSNIYPFTLSYDGFTLNCSYQVQIITPSPTVTSCPPIKIENSAFVPTGSNYTATFTVTGAPPTINGHKFLGYTFSNEQTSTTPQQLVSIADCYDATLKKTAVSCTADYTPVCGCNGVTYSNSCYAEALNGYSVGHTGECTGNEKIPFKITSMPPGITIDFDIDAKYEGYTLTGCSVHGKLTTPVTPPAPTCPDIKVENVQFTQNGDSYNATFTLTGAPAQLDGHVFQGYSLYNITNAANPSQILNYKNCIDAGVIRSNSNCTSDYTPICACNGVTYSNSCVALYQNGYATAHTGVCTDAEKVQFTITGISGSNSRVDFGIKLFYENYIVGNCRFSNSVTTPNSTIPQPTTCSDVKFENLQLTPNGSNYDASFTLTGASNSGLRTKQFKGYSFANVKNSTNPTQTAKITDCYDASLLITDACRFIDFPFPTCGCNGVSYYDACYARGLSGYNVLHSDTCTGKEKVVFKITGILPGSRIDFDALANYLDVATSTPTNCKYTFGFSTPPAASACNLAASTINTIVKCGSVAQTFDLTANNSAILGNSTGTVNWYADAGAQNLISTPNNYSSLTGTVYAQIANGAGCKSNIITVQLNVRPNAAILPANVTAICSGNSVTLTATGGNSYKWASGETTNNITVSQAGTYTVTVTDNYGCTNTSSKTLGISTANPVFIVGNTNLCPGFSTNLTAYGYQTYIWSTGSMDAGINVTTPGNYSVTVTDNNGCRLSKSITVIGLAKPEIKAIGNILSSTYPSGNEWFFNGQILSGITTQQYKALKSGNYQVRVTTNGCSFFSDIFAYTVTASNDISDAGIKIYPNPSTGQIFIETADASIPIKIKLINAVGQTVKSETLTTNSGTLYCEDIPDGFYIVHIDTGKNVFSRILMIMK